VCRPTMPSCGYCKLSTRGGQTRKAGTSRADLPEVDEDGGDRRACVERGGEDVYGCEAARERTPGETRSQLYFAHQRKCFCRM
jgi:hypothetical protein